MKILIIGGTRFVGRTIVENLIEQNHEVTLFNRGTNKEIFPNLPKIIGDRNKDIEKIGTQKFDIVIDTCAYLPQQIEKSAKYLKDKVKKYVFISTISVFKDFTEPNIDENSEKEILNPEIDPNKLKITDIDYTNYGALKYQCEQKLNEIMPQKNIIIRPGMIIGPYDNTERFARWIKAFIQNQNILVPKPEELPIQFIDVYDLSQFIIHLINKDDNKTYNVIGPEKNTTFKEIFELIKKETNSKSKIYWANTDFLKNNDLIENLETNFPFFVSEKYKNTYTVNNQKAIKNGLKLTTNEKIIQRIIKHHKNQNDLEIKTGIKPQKEQELINKLTQQKNK